VGIVHTSGCRRPCWGFNKSEEDQNLSMRIILMYSLPLNPRYLDIVIWFNIQNPHTYREAAWNSFWEETMQEEYNSLLENQNWDLVTLILYMNLVRRRWVCRTKKAVDEHVSRHKERLVVNGF
jgi:hypothetical protein